MAQQISSELPHIETDPLSRISSSQNTEAGISYGEAQTESRANLALEQGMASPGQSQAGAMAKQLAIPPAPIINPHTLGTTGSPQIADDTDLIEKEWVIKAKEIIERTKHDPYQQNKQVERMKVDYMKKRYNKDVKLTED